MLEKLTRITNAKTGRCSSYDKAGRNNSYWLMPVERDLHRRWVFDKKNQTASRPIPLNAEMRAMKQKWARRQK